jgi:peptide/nickel transport system permease protein
MNEREARPPRPSLARSLAATLLNLALVVLLGGFAAAALVRFSPGFDVDENAWNPKISAATLEAMHAERERESQLPRFYLNYLRSAFHGDFGQSDSFRQPVGELLRRRAPVTLELVGWGVAGGMLLGGLLAWVAVWPRRASLGFAASAVSGLLLAIPPAVMALAFFAAEAPLAGAVALALLPRVFGTLRALLEELAEAPPLLAARARGVGRMALARRYVLAPAAPRLIALTGLALVIAFGTAIPVEALCGVPGIGQLAWKSALARDLPLLCGLALITTFIVALMQSAGDMIGERY